MYTQRTNSYFTVARILLSGLKLNARNVQKFFDICVYPKWNNRSDQNNKHDWDKTARCKCYKVHLSLIPTGFFFSWTLGVKAMTIKQNSYKYLLISYSIWNNGSWSLVGLWQFLRLFLRKMNCVISGGSLGDEFRFLKFEFHGFAISCIRGRPGNKKRSASQAISGEKGRAVVSQMGRGRLIAPFIQRSHITSKKFQTQQLPVILELTSSVFKRFPSTLKRKSGVFKFLRFRRPGFRQVPFLWWISVDGRSNRRSCVFQFLWRCRQGLSERPRTTSILALATMRTEQQIEWIFVSRYLTFT